MLPMVLYSWTPYLVIYLVWLMRRKPFRRKKVYRFLKLGFTAKH